MCELSISEYNKIHNTNLPENHHELTLKELYLKIDNNMTDLSNPPIVWLTGLPNSGKTTITYALDAILAEQCIGTVILDGNSIRTGLCKDLSFSPEDRIENARRIAEVAKIASEAGCLVIVAAINPFHTSRQLVKDILGLSYIEIFLDCPLYQCVERDTKDLYSRAILGEITIPYERPLEPHLIIDSGDDDVQECAQKIFDFIRNRL